MAFTESDLISISNNTVNNKKINKFLHDLKDVLKNNGARLVYDECELYIEGVGYVGFIEDNIDSLELVDSGEVIVSVNK